MPGLFESFIKHHLLKLTLGTAIAIGVQSTAHAQLGVGTDNFLTPENKLYSDRYLGYNCPTPEMAFNLVTEQLRNLKSSIETQCAALIPDFEIFNQLITRADTLKRTVSLVASVDRVPGMQRKIKELEERRKDPKKGKKDKYGKVVPLTPADLTAIQEEIDRLNAGIQDAQTKAEAKKNELEQYREEIRSYSQQFSTASAQLIAQIRGKGKECFQSSRDPEAERQQLFSVVSTLVLQVTQQVSSAAGPYAVPVAAGGVVASSVISAIPEMFRKYGLNMNKEVQRQLYTEAICRLRQVDDMKIMLDDPLATRNEMDDLANHLKEKLDEMELQCGEPCKAAIRPFREKPPYAGFVPTVTPQAQYEVNQIFLHPMGTIMTQSLEVNRWLRATAIPRFNSMLRDNPNGVSLGRAAANDKYNEIYDVLISRTTRDYMRWSRNDFVRKVRAFLGVPGATSQDDDDDVLSLDSQQLSQLKAAIAKDIESQKNKSAVDLRRFRASKRGRDFIAMVDSVLRRKIYCDFFNASEFPASETTCDADEKQAPTNPRSRKAALKDFEEAIQQTFLYQQEDARIIWAQTSSNRRSWVANMTCVINAWNGDDSRWVKWSDLQNGNTGGSDRVATALTQVPPLIDVKKKTVSVEFYDRYLNCGAKPIVPEPGDGSEYDSEPNDSGDPTYTYGGGFGGY